ncbi:MAG: glutamate-1-semialdehyde 2,1-aminomutase [Holophagaceae bacterium]
MNNDRLYDEAKNFFPGGVNSPVRAFKSVGGVPKFFKKAEGAWFIDEENQKYLDLCMSWGPLILGHAHPEVINAVSSALKEGLTFGAPSRRENALARRIKSMVPFLEKMRFVSSGTEAVMSAIRVSRGFTGRSRLLKFDGCYHGHSDSVLVKAGSGLATFGEPTSAGVPRESSHLTSVLPLDNIEALESFFSVHGSELAAAIIEPIPANNGLLLQDLRFLRRLRELCTKYETVLIFDEVITGFRVSPSGASGLYKIYPDLVTYGKIIGGGMPVGLYGGRSDIMSCVSPDGPVYQAGTLSGNPIAMTAGLATLELLDDSLYSVLQKRGAQWSKIFELIPGCRCPHVGSILWPMFQSRVKQSCEIQESSITSFNKLHQRLLALGVYLPPSGYEVTFLSLAHDEHELSFFQDQMAKINTIQGN